MEKPAVKNIPSSFKRFWALQVPSLQNKVNWDNWDNLYYNYNIKGVIRRRRQKKYENLKNMKNRIHTWQIKYENLVEPQAPDFHTFSIHLSNVARFSYLFNLLLRIGQICILFQSPCQNLPDCHTFSIFSKFGRLALVNWAKLKKFQNLILKCLIPSEPERAAEARRAVVASFFKVAKMVEIASLEECRKNFWFRYF